MGRTAPLTSKRCILYIYSTNTGTEYFKRALYSPFFSLRNEVCFIMLTCLVPVLFTFYIQGVLKLKKNNSGAKGLITDAHSSLSTAFCCHPLTFISHRSFTASSNHLSLGLPLLLLSSGLLQNGPGSSVGIATDYGLDGPGIESRWRRDFPHLSRQALGPTQPPVQCVQGFCRG